MRVAPRRLGPAVAFAALWAAGCGTDPAISSYRVPRSTEAGQPAPPDAPAGDYRILGAMYPADDPQWFLKLTGPADAVAKNEAAFDKLAATLALPAGGAKAPTFTLPEGWKLAGPRSIHAETVRTPDGLEMTVTASVGGVAANVDRWAGQVGAANPAGATRPLDAAGVKGLRVDLRGPKNPSAGGMGPMMGKK
ncbi:MAG: hypothetical protein K2X87_21050 [Gemmataceae bacterium]|nr:hypothetical protein [Gemmataceae bacterium]